MDNSYDLVVIGGGPGGYVAAVRAAQLGLKTAVIEERDMGGTCLNRGCIPTKALLHAAELYHSVCHCASFGLSVEGAAFDYGKMATRKDSVVSQLRSGIESLVKGNGGTILRGRATIKDSQTIEVSGQDEGIIRTRQMIIATGSRPAKLPVPGMDGDKVLDSDDVLALTACPGRLVIIGGGVIGVEFATLFNSLGKEVTIVEMMDSLVPGLDADLSAALRKTLARRGIRIFTGARVTALHSADTALCTFTQDGAEKTAEGDILVVAAGRKPNTENLGLDNLGLQLTRGYIQTDKRTATSVPGVFAIGDVTGRAQLAHAASAQGLVAAGQAAGLLKTLDDTIMPACLYSSPEIAWVGLTESDAVKGGHRVKTGLFPVSANGRSLIMGEIEGFSKIVTDADTGEILGAQIMGPRATDLISEICVAMKLESTIDEIADTIHPHPTVSEMIMEAAHDVENMSIHKSVQKSVQKSIQRK